jgi:hypothetical protein
MHQSDNTTVGSNDVTHGWPGTTNAAPSKRENLFK